MCRRRGVCSDDRIYGRWGGWTLTLKVGASPVFVDVDLTTRNIDLKATEAAITRRTKAIIPTHFAGLPVDMEGLYTLATQRGLRVIEDAALAIGSTWRDKRIGSFGDLVTFSFHPNKTMTTIEGGALVVNNEDEVRRVEKLRVHGVIRLPNGTRDVDFPGGKFNLSDVSARLGLAQLKQLEAFNAKRRDLVEHYFNSFQTDPPCMLPARGYPGEENGHSWNMFCVLLPLNQLNITRHQFMLAMRERGIGVGVAYEALHLTTLYRAAGYREGDFPNTERIARETVTLPLFPTMTMSDVERVCQAVSAIFKRSKIRSAV